MKHPPLMPSLKHPRGFTLIEMLLVVAIIGILVTMLAPRLQMLGAPRVTAAARVLTQMTRYARTMALLHQAETVLSVSPDGLLRVGAGGTTAAAPSEANRFDTPSGTGSAPFMTSTAGGDGAGGGSLFLADDTGSGLFGEAQESPSSAAPPAFADEISIERRVENVTILFLGYTDNIEALQAQPDPIDFSETGSVIRFRSNGTCRPHRYKLTDETGVEVWVTVDMLGMARVETGEGAR